MDLMSIAQLLGNFGEFLGAIAVVVTLAYLAIQIRESAKSTESNAIAQAASDHLANMRLIADNAELSEAYRKATNGEVLTEAEASQLQWWMYCFIRGGETHVQMAKLGVVPEYSDPWIEILRLQAANSEMARKTMENWIGTETFINWLQESVLQTSTEKITNAD